MTVYILEASHAPGNYYVSDDEAREHPCVTMTTMPEHARAWDSPRKATERSAVIPGRWRVVMLDVAERAA